MEFYKKTDEKKFWKLMEGAIQHIVPLNVSGNSPEERLMAAAASVNPMIRVPAEFMTGMSFYQGGDTVPRRMQDAEPTEQYTKRTNDNIIIAARAAGVSPLKLRQALDSFTGGLSRSVLPDKPAEGEASMLSKIPILSRFSSSTYREIEGKDQLDEARMDSATDSVKRSRMAEEFLRSKKGMEPEEVLRQAVEKYWDSDRLAVERIKAELIQQIRGITPRDKILLSLATKQRAQIIIKDYAKIPDAGRVDFINGLISKRILTEETGAEMIKQGFKQPAR
jgi:hypothetical protein